MFFRLDGVNWVPFWATAMLWFRGPVGVALTDMVEVVGVEVLTALSVAVAVAVMSSLASGIEEVSAGMGRGELLGFPGDSRGSNRGAAFADTCVSKHEQIVASLIRCMVIDGLSLLSLEILACTVVWVVSRTIEGEDLGQRSLAAYDECS